MDAARSRIRRDHGAASGTPLVEGARGAGARDAHLRSERCRPGSGAQLRGRGDGHGSGGARRSAAHRLRHPPRRRLAVGCRHLGPRRRHRGRRLLGAACRRRRRGHGCSPVRPLRGRAGRHVAAVGLGRLVGSGLRAAGSVAELAGAGARGRRIRRRRVDAHGLDHLESRLVAHPGDALGRAGAGARSGRSGHRRRCVREQLRPTDRVWHARRGGRCRGDGGRNHRNGAAQCHDGGWRRGPRRRVLRPYRSLAGLERDDLHRGECCDRRRAGRRVDFHVPETGGRGPAPALGPRVRRGGPGCGDCHGGRSLGRPRSPAGFRDHRGGTGGRSGRGRARRHGAPFRGCGRRGSRALGRRLRVHRRLG